MRRRLAFVLPLLIGVPAIFLGAADASPKPVEFSDARLKVEINATDGDAGLQVFLDGEAWNQVELLDPDGNPIVDVDVTGRAEDYGLTELFSESSEPPFEEFPLEQFKALFPEGTYTFRGTTVDGTPMTGTASLTHDFPDGPEIVCRTLSEGPFGIESQADVESVTMPLRRLVESDNEADAYLGNPGLILRRVARTMTRRPGREAT